VTLNEEIGFSHEIGDELWGWITDTPDGRRSLIGVLMPGVGHTPLVFASQEAATRVTPLALSHGKEVGQPVRLVHFRAVEQFEARKVKP
jgi:hypothetical protein